MLFVCLTVGVDCWWWRRCVRVQTWPFKVINDNGKPIIEVEYRGEAKRFKPEEISSMVLSKMKEVTHTHNTQHRRAD